VGSIPHSWQHLIAVLTAACAASSTACISTAACGVPASTRNTITCALTAWCTCTCLRSQQSLLRAASAHLCVLTHLGCVLAVCAHDGEALACGVGRFVSCWLPFAACVAVLCPRGVVGYVVSYPCMTSESIAGTGKLLAALLRCRHSIACNWDPQELRTIHKHCCYDCGMLLRKRCQKPSVGCM
jgi:hypothetical protein